MKLCHASYEEKVRAVENFLMEEKNIQYVVAAKMKSFPKTKKKEILEADFEPTVVENEFQWFKEFEHKEG